MPKVTASFPSPAPSDSDFHDHDDAPEAGPATKRPRTSITSEERKEARAHRNRIAAQNSRDRRKAQFSYLERRVNELEEENRLLRSGAALPMAVAGLASASEEHRRAERERERERENEELKDRIRTLEQGWNAVVKALAAQGLPTGIAPAAAPTQAQAPTPAPSAAPSTTTTSTTSSPTSSLPINTAAFTAFPSPAPSHASLDFDVSIGGPRDVHQQLRNDSARHLAAGGLIASANAFSTPSLHTRTPAQIPPPIITETTNDDNEKAMESLIRQILASPCLPSPPIVSTAGTNPAQVMLGVQDGSGVESVGEAEGLQSTDKEKTNVMMNQDNTQDLSVADWANEIQMQRMLDEMIEMSGLTGESELGASGVPIVSEFTSPELLDIGLGLNLDMDFNMELATTSAWDVDAGMGGVGVF